MMVGFVFKMVSVSPSPRNRQLCAVLVHHTAVLELRENRGIPCPNTVNNTHLEHKVYINFLKEGTKVLDAAVAVLSER